MRTTPSAAATSRASNYGNLDVYPDKYTPRHRDIERLAISSKPAAHRWTNPADVDDPSRPYLYSKSIYRPGVIIRAALHVGHPFVVSAILLYNRYGISIRCVVEDIPCVPCNYEQAMLISRYVGT